MGDSLPIFHSCLQLMLDIAGESSPENIPALANAHIERCTTTARVLCPEFVSGLKWFNTTRPLTMVQDLRGKIVVLHFFTSCCVNCQHVLPELEELGRMYSLEDGVVVVGVHSPKFNHEKHSSTVLNAVLKHNITHPVVSDPECRLSQSLSIGCWPTILVLGPEGEVVFVFMGEGHRKYLFLGVRRALHYFKARGLISGHHLPLHLEKHLAPSSFLSYPSKICASPDGRYLAIADSGHHRIVLASSDGLVLDIVGNGEKDFKDGDYGSCAFSSPHGLCWSNENVLYVADAENHAIRKVDLCRRSVQTVAGNGQIGEDEEGGALGLCQMINTPLDVCMVNSTAASPDNPDVLLIAMAGLHQIWLLTLRDGVSWYNHPEILRDGVCFRAYGSGHEEHRNNLYPHKAGFAQPSGLAFSLADMSLYVADSESSAVRLISLHKGTVKNIVGASRDPTDLHTFGDADGTGAEVRLQRPLGLAYSHRLGKILIADTYNHKIKFIDSSCRSCDTLIGDGQIGDTEGLGSVTRLDEPAGLCLVESENDSILYIADTNNHCIKIVDLNTNVSHKLSLTYRSDIIPRNQISFPNDGRICIPPTVVNVDKVFYRLHEPISFHLEIFGPHGSEALGRPSWKVSVNMDGILEHLHLLNQEISHGTGRFDKVADMPSLPCATRPDFLRLTVRSSLPVDRSSFVLTVDVTVLFMDQKTMASRPKLIRFHVPCCLLCMPSREPTSDVDLKYVIGV